jgi:hypothetical protein
MLELFTVLAALLLLICFAWLTKRPFVSRPVLLIVSQKGKSPMSDVLTYQVTVGAPVDHDVVSRQLTVTVDGVSNDARFYDGGATDLGTIEVVQNSNVVLSLVDVDDAGNYSEPAVVEFVASDTLRPSTPGSFSVTLVSERPADEV